MRYLLLSILKNTPDYVSGEELSMQLGVTRASIWKHIKALKEEGYVIDGISNKGYKLISSSNVINEFEIKSNLNSKFMGKVTYHYKNIDSTNLKAKEIARSNFEDGTLIISNTQTLGKGRFERKWCSPEGGLWFSLILKPLISPMDASKITLLVAQSIFKALTNLKIDIKIKWPNDLLINDKKFCGILTEMNSDMDKINYIIVGIGINTNISKDSFDDSIKDITTSLKIETKTEIDNISLLCTILEIFEKDYLKYITTLEFNDPLKILKENSNIIGKMVYVKTLRNNFQAKCIDIDNNGNLILQKDSGEIVVQNSGEISTKK